MVEKDKAIVTEARPNKSVSALKVEDVQPKTSGGSVQPEPKLPEDAWRCFVTTTKGSKLLLFLKPTLDVKQILSEYWVCWCAACHLTVTVVGNLLQCVFR